LPSSEAKQLIAHTEQQMGEARGSARANCNAHAPMEARNFSQNVFISFDQQPRTVLMFTDFKPLSDDTVLIDEFATEDAGTLVLNKVCY
jgi:hypothetical protein